MADPVELILDFLRRHRFLKAEAAFMAELLSREEDGRRPPSPSESVLHQNPQLQSLHDIQCTIGVSGNVGDENLKRPLHRDNAGSSKSKKGSSFQEDARFPPEKQLYVEYEPGRVISPDRFCTTSGDFHGEDTGNIPKGEAPLSKSEELVTPPIQALDRGSGGANRMVSKILQAEHAVTRLNKATDGKQQSDLTSNSLGIQLPIQNQVYHKDELTKESDPCTPGLSCNIESKKSALKKQDKANGLDLLIEGQVASGTNRVEHCMELSLEAQNAVFTDLLDKGVERGSVAKVLPSFLPKVFAIAEQQMLYNVEGKISLNENIRKNCIANSGKVEAALSQALVNGNSGLSVDSKSLEFYTTSVHESGDLPRLPLLRLHSLEENRAFPTRKDGSLANQNIPTKISELNILENNDGMHEETLGLHTSTDTLLGMDFPTSGLKPSMLRSSVSQGIVEALPDHLPAISNAADGWYPDDYCDSDTYEDDDDPGYHRQPIEDEEWFLANEIDYPSDEERPRQCTDKLSLKNAVQSTKIEEDGASYGEEESYFSGEEYYGLHSAKKDYRKPHFSESRGLDSDDNLTSLNVQQLELDQGKLAMLGNDIMTNKIEEEGFETREPDSMCPTPAWKGFVGHPVDCDEYDSDIDGCKINPDADDDNRGSVRSGGIFISSDIADVGSEQRDSLLGGSSEGDVESLKDQPQTTSKLVSRSFDSKKSNNYEWEMPTKVKNTSDQHYEESSSEHDLVLQYYNEAWGLCKRSTDKELASRSIWNSNKPSGNEQLTDSRKMRLYDNGGSMFEGFSFPSPSSTGGVAISAAGSGRSLQSNRESTVQADETDGYGAAMVGPNDTLAAWRQKSNNSSPIIYSSEDNLQSFELPDQLSGSFQSTDYHEDLSSKDRKHGDEEAKLDCQLVLSQIPMQGEEDALSGQEEMKTLNNADDYFEVFSLRVIHRKNRTGFEEEKDFPITINSIIAGRYHVTEYLGSAAFSKAIQAHDLHTGMDVCMKIIKNNKDFFDQSLDEIKLLKFINQQDPADKHHILRLYDYFYHREHLFIVCELLRANLYEFHKFNRESGGEVYFTMPRIQSITRQCLEALDFLHRLGIIHCDLKPENILVKSYSRCEVKIIDLGSSCFQTDHLCSYVQSRSYRAPEVILGLPYDQKIDIWSLGCILAELCTGNVLFQNDSLATLLVRVVGILGPIDPEILAKGHDTHKYFTKNHMIYERNQETDQLEYLIPKKTSLTHRLPLGDHGFVEFVRYLLQCNPSKRPSATAALQHPWLSFPYEPISS